MDDLISRQLVMKTLCERRCGDKPKGCPSGFCTESLAVDCIPSAKPAQQWIPCSERLPEDVQVGEEYPTVIFCTKEETYTGFYEYYRGGRWWREDYDEIVEGVLAWMPKPAPYKEERREE